MLFNIHVFPTNQLCDIKQIINLAWNCKGYLHWKIRVFGKLWRGIKAKPRGHWLCVLPVLIYSFLRLFFSKTSPFFLVFFIHGFVVLLCCFVFLRPGPTAARTITITMTTQRERTILVEWACAYSAWSTSTNTMRSLCVVIVIIFVIAAVWLGL